MNEDMHEPEERRAQTTEELAHAFFLNDLEHGRDNARILDLIGAIDDLAVEYLALHASAADLKSGL